MAREHDTDIEAVLAKRHSNGGDYWASADGRLAVGSPFSTLESLQILHELGLGRDHEAVRGSLDLMLAASRDDGRFQLTPKGAIYPCQTANTARVLCRYGYAEDGRLRPTFSHLLEIQHDDGGWRCNRFAFGRGPETEYSNPGATLFALDAFRFTKRYNDQPELGRAAESLLDHWTLKRPLGPCQFGIGTLFMQVEYPFLRYNIFSYVYVLSFYERAKSDDRFQEALRVLESKIDDRGRIIVERPNRNLAGLATFAKGRPSEPATARYNEIRRNLAHSASA